jgi:oxygen-independent coproporphyrinogen-3 oxidase
MAELISRRLVEAGFVRIGLDHFARPEDTMATRPLARNFQGYTTDKATTLIGMGASAIGRIGDAYVQNATPMADYMRRVEADGLAVARGFEMGEEDCIRAFAIERLMCDLAFSAHEAEQRFGAKAAILKRDADRLIAADQDRLVEPTGDGFRVTERGRPFLRSICAQFDRYFRAGTARHAAGV